MVSWSEWPPGLVCVLRRGLAGLGCSALPKEQSRSLGTQPLPRVLKLATSKDRQFRRLWPSRWDFVSCPCLVRRMFRAVRAPKLLLEVRRGDHAVANGPAGGNLLQVSWGCGVCAPFTLAFGACCGNYSPCGAFDGATGRARDEARHGAIGGTALKWLSVFLRGEYSGDLEASIGASERVVEATAQLLGERPLIASGWQYEGLGMSRV